MSFSATFVKILFEICRKICAKVSSKDGFNSSQKVFQFSFRTLFVLSPVNRTQINYYCIKYKIKLQSIPSADIYYTIIMQVPRCAASLQQSGFDPRRLKFLPRLQLRGLVGQKPSRYFLPKNIPWLTPKNLCSEFVVNAYVLLIAIRSSHRNCEIDGSPSSF